jgi:2-isopropylmalate synthase
LQIEFRNRVQEVADASGKEIKAPDLWAIFEGAYLKIPGGHTLIDYREEACGDTQRQRRMRTVLRDAAGRDHMVTGIGRGPVDGFVHGLADWLGIPIRVIDYREHAMSPGADARAAAYVELTVGGDDRAVFGVGLDEDVTAATLRAVLSAVDRHAARASVQQAEEARCQGGG